MIDIRPLEHRFNSLQSMPIIDRLCALRSSTSHDEKQAIYDEAMIFLEKQGKIKKWKKVFEKALTT